jgi:hypothetical protein
LSGGSEQPDDGLRSQDTDGPNSYRWQAFASTVSDPIDPVPVAFTVDYVRLVGRDDDRRDDAVTADGRKDDGLTEAAIPLVT